MSLITVDRTGFPLLRIEALKLDVHLLPVTKIQFELYLAEPNGFDDRWYEELLKVNPRCSWRNLCEQTRVQAFLTGIRPEEAQVFALWLGVGFRLPTVAEWQAVCRRWLDERVELLSKLPEPCAGDPLIRALLAARAGTSLSDQSHMAGGVLEWVQGRRGWQLLGQPSQSLRPNLFHWRTSVLPTQLTRRSGTFGFRLVRNT